MSPEQLKQLEDQLWKSADDLRANSDLSSNEYGTPVLGLIFLKFADGKFKQHQAAIEAEYKRLKGSRRERTIEHIAIEKCGFWLPEEARYDHLLALPEDADIAQALKHAMVAIERHKPELEGVLPKNEYFDLTRRDNTLPHRLLQNFANIPDTAEGDLFGRIYEYFLAKFALAEGQGGGEFFTPTSVVRLMVAIIEPHGGKVLDPACGSGGMFVQSARFIETHRAAQRDNLDLYVCGQEKTLATVKLARMNLAVNGLRGEIHQAISYYEDPANGFENYDYVLANPPFNVDEVNYAGVKDDPRFNTFGVPRRKTRKKSQKANEETVPNANYLWINLFATSLKPQGRAALVMANSASDARHSEADIRRRLIEANLIYGMLTLPSNMFYTVTLPATLWFFDRDKAGRLPAERADKILFIDARNVFTQIDRAHREFSAAQIENLAIISHLYREDRQAFVDLVDAHFKAGMAHLAQSAEHAPEVADQLIEHLHDKACLAATDALRDQWRESAALIEAWEQYQGAIKTADIDARNQAQHTLAAPFAAFFADLHRHQKALDKALRELERREAEANGGRRRPDRDMKQIKQALEALHANTRDAEQCFDHVAWLQSRFPDARYEDVTGLCKAASREEVAEQDYSLNPGRYVGVVIEEDGKTEEEYLEFLAQASDQLGNLDKSANSLMAAIRSNLRTIGNFG
jgi:type I restriction enzyme M protein